MEKTIIYNITDDEYNVTLYNDDSVDVMHADGFIECFDFADEFFSGYYGVDNAAILAACDYYRIINPLSDAQPTDAENKAMFKTLLISKIKSVALDTYYNGDIKLRGTDYVVVDVHSIIPDGMSIEEVKRIIRLKATRKLVPCFINDMLNINVTQASKK